MNKVEAPIGFVENSNVAPQIQESSQTNSKQFNDVATPYTEES